MRESSGGSDLEAVERVLAGDLEAFDGLVRRWQGPLVNMAYRYCRNRGQAEEWAQEAFIKVYKNLGRWRRDSKFSTWLFAVAVNVFRSLARRYRPPEVPIADEHPLVGPIDTALQVEAEQRNEIARRAVCSLPQKYRDAMVLFYFEDLGVAEVGRVLNLPAGTVKARLHRGRVQLEKRLRKVLGPGVKGGVVKEAT